MRLHYRAIDGGNFGDDLNLVLWRELFPGLEQQAADVTLYGIGTILGGDHDSRAVKVVLGSGLGYRRTPRLDSSWDIRWVRGLDSARLLGLPPERALGDGATLWSGLAPAASPGTRVGLVPHHATWSSFDWAAVAQRAGLHAIDPTMSPEAVADELRQCSRVLTESLHGAIFADAMGLPWAPCVLSYRFNRFKWLDWLSLLDREFTPFVADRSLVRTLPGRKAWTNRLARWSGLGNRARLGRLRPVAAATPEDAASVASQLTVYAGRPGHFRCSEAAAIARQRDRMLDSCARFARDYGLDFRG